MSEADYEEVVGICTLMALIVSFSLRHIRLATTLIYAQDDFVYHNFYVSLQSLPRDVYLDCRMRAIE